MLSNHPGFSTQLNWGLRRLYTRSNVPLLFMVGHRSDSWFRYFFHATEIRMDTDEYNEEAEDEAGPGGAGSVVDVQAPVAADDNSDTEDDEEPEPKVKEEDPDLGGWFKVDDRRSPTLSSIDAPDDSATENDSDNDDVKQEEDPDLDDWFDVKETDTEGVNPPQTEVGNEEAVNTFLSIESFGMDN